MRNGLLHARARARGAFGARAPALDVGAEVPELHAESADGTPMALSALRGRPVVVAFSPQWKATGSAGNEDELGAELRGLGAVLLVVAEGGIWLHRADDPPRHYRLARASGGSPEAVHHAFGIVTGAVALFVIDARGVVRFRSAGAESGGDEGRVVLAALRAAGEALRAVPAPGRPIVLNRRELVLSTLVAAFSLFALDGCEKPEVAPPPATPPKATPGPGSMVPVTLDVNGTARTLSLEPRVTLLDALREQLGLMGSKKGCDHGQCGACTVLVDGRRINACLTLAIMQQGTKITTIEGLARGDVLHPLQAAFIEHDAFQCGYCTPGQILSAAGLLNEGGARSADEIREKMSGNICRCGAYNNIVAAIQAAQAKG